MRLRLRPLTFAILLAGTAGSANAADLLEAYEMARQSDPVLSASESRSLATGEGVVQSRAALLPQLDGSVSWSRTETDSTGSQAFGAVVQPPSESSSENTSRGWSVNLRQSLYDHGNYTRLSAARARAGQAEAEYKAAQDELNALILFKSDMAAYVRMYGFLSQIFNYGNTDIDTVGGILKNNDYVNGGYGDFKTIASTEFTC